jgi:hypothetical protein
MTGLNPGMVRRLPFLTGEVGVTKRAIPAIGLLLLGLTIGVRAQVQLGDDLKMNMDAIISGGYTANYGNTTVSGHGFTAGGTADLNGSYYSPNFLSFHVQPYYNQARANSAFQSITDASGVNISSAIFSGSNFPGNVSYSRSYNSEGTFGVPGISGVTTHGNGQTLSIGWSEIIPDKPAVSANFSMGDNNYSIFGLNEQSNSNFKNFTTSASYVLEGWRLTGNYHYSNTDVNVPVISPLEQAQQSKSSDNTFGLGASHNLPLNGSISFGGSRSYTDSRFTGGSFNGNIDNLSGGLSFHPGNFNFGTNTQYTDNLTGTIIEAILGVGGAVPTNLSQSSHSLDINNYASYTWPQRHLTFSGNFEHRAQSILDTALTANSYGGTVNYANDFMGGFLNLTGGVSENTIDVNNQRTLALIGSAGYARRINRWNVSAGFNYAQNQQTLLVAYTTSNYGYTGSVGRKIGDRSYFSLSTTGSKTTLTQTGTGTFNHSYTGSVGISHWITATGSYSKSSGDAILTGGGLVPTPVPTPIVVPTSLILYGGHAYSLGLGSSPMRGLTISASYARAFSNTSSVLTFSNNKNEVFNARVEYQVRQMYFQAGYTRLVQGFSLSGQPPIMLGSIYVGISRWFNFF